jgi:hypothetical protein
VARFVFKGATYDLVETDDLTFQEVTDMEEETGFNLAAGKVSVAGLVWISVRRKWPKTTWADVAEEKLLQIEWLADDEDDVLPPTLNGAADTRPEGAPRERQVLTDSGSPG